MGQTLLARAGGAPISWGVCEAPGWGHELPASTVLAEMAELGLRVTELGPTGYLGTEPAEVRASLDAHGLRLVGGFVPVPMHLEADMDLAEAGAAVATLAAAGAEVVVLAARSADGSYDRKVVLDDRQWDLLLGNLDRLQDMARAHGLLPTLHPHVGTAVQDRDSVLRLLADSDVAICLDTGHLIIGGMDPMELVTEHGDRVAHVHLKDVRLPVAARIAAAEDGFIGGVRAGMFAPLGEGDVDLPGVIGALEGAGYRGWYVLEQDCALYAPPMPGTGPIEDVRRSLEFLAKLGGGEDR
jgi:inosose dehydratase